MSVTEQSLTAVIGDLYAGAYDRSAWTSAVGRLKMMFQASQVCLARIGPDIGPDDAINPDADPVLQRKAMPYLVAPNALVSAFMRAPVGRVYRDDHDLVDRKTMRRLAFWNEYMAPMDMYGGLGCKVQELGSSQWFIDMQRGRNQPAFDASERDLLQTLMPHIMRAYEIGRNFDIGQALASAFSRLSFGVVLVNGEGRILTMNDAAEDALALRASPLEVRAGRLATKDSETDAALAALIRDACRRTKDILPGRGGDLLLRGASDGAPPVVFAVSVSPVVDMQPGGALIERAAIVSIRRVTLDLPQGFEEQIRNLYSLAPKEARLATALAAGRSLKEAATAERIAFSTARSYLENIFRKTGARQQSQLVALLKSVEPLIRR